MLNIINISWTQFIQLIFQLLLILLTRILLILFSFSINKLIHLILHLNLFLTDRLSLNCWHATLLLILMLLMLLVLLLLLLLLLMLLIRPFPMLFARTHNIHALNFLFFPIHNFLNTFIHYTFLLCLLN